MKRGWIFWLPRIISIIFILFLALFSLDVFGNGYTFWQTVLGLFMHNIPSLILLILTIIAWKRDLVGAFTFFIAGLVYISFMIYNAFTSLEFYMLSYSLIIAGPAFFIGILYYINYKRKKHVSIT